MTTDELLQKSEAGFKTLGLDQHYVTSALGNLKEWLTKKEFSIYTPQIIHFIESSDWNYLMDCFFQIIPFGTGGRRGEVGIGPNRINEWTIMASAQGHSQYLIKQHGEEAKTRGLVFTYDVRVFYSNAHFNEAIDNPVKGLDGLRLAKAAASVYAANGIKIYMFDDVRTTPELSFAIRHLHAIAGDMFSASHNPPDHNGKKVYDEFGGQLIPPFDENLVDEVTQNVTEIQSMPYEQAVAEGKVVYLGKDVDDAYIKAACAVSLSDARDIKIVYTPMHGCGGSSVLPVLKRLGFEVHEDPKTSNPSGKFENITFNIPNPEVEQSFETPLEYAKEINADILLNSDPDADRFGIMVKHHGEWVFVNGNEMAGILCEYVIQKKKDPQGVVIKTAVTTNLLKNICEAHGVRLIGDLLVGYKYIGAEMNKLEQEGNIDHLLMGCEESHGYIAGNYVRDKDATTAAIWFAELAAELKAEGRTIIDYLEDVYKKYGYFRNYLTEVRMLGAIGLERIRKIQNTLRAEPPKMIGEFEVERMQDYLENLPILSETDRNSKDLMVFHLKPFRNVLTAKVTVRPSGTEPKIKMYFELSMDSKTRDLDVVKTEIEEELTLLEKAFMLHCYGILNVDFPDRGFMLFWQLPLDTKMEYFKKEEDIAKIVELPKEERSRKLDEMLAFLGSDPIDKIGKAFETKYGKPLKDYLEV